ncbi:MAG: hypothetical protein L3J35_09275 [Bacteroidales bacterium]|nr:hypothetical protein [Bacteroidales bacterium]
MVIEGIFYVIFWIIFFILIGLSIHLVNVSKDEGLSIVFGVLVFLLFLLAMKPELKPVKPLKDIILATVQFDWLTFIAGGIVLGSIGFLGMKFLKKHKVIAKLASSFLIFIALTFGVSLIWMTSIAPILSNALLGLMFTGLFSYLFLK